MSGRWRTPGLAMLAGAAAALAHPPFGVVPGLLGFGLLMHQLDSVDQHRPNASAFWRGWLAGAAYFLISTWWVAEAFLVEPEVHGWQAPFAVFFLAGGLGLLWGAAGLAYRLIRPDGPWRVITFAAVFGLFEWLRGHILTGFPWDLPGEAWRAGGAVSQSASVIGAYGLSVVTLAVAAAPAVWLGGDRRRQKIAATGVAALVLAVIAGYGALRLASAPAGVIASPALRVRVVQPDIEQAAKWTPEAFRSIFSTYTGLTGQPAADGRPPDVVVWPESAIPADSGAYLAEGTWTRSALMAALRPGQILMMGAVRSEGARYYNSALAVRRDAGGLSVIATYDKHHLVPFGEYMPMDALMGAIGFKALVHIGEGFTPGRPPAPVSAPGLPMVQPLICYESLFPAFVRRGPRPAWIANLSNDAWFGKTSGPWQHLNLASYRAIEEGLPMVRATPTGVSAVVDAYGRPLRRLGLGIRGVIDTDLPAAAATTPFRAGGDWPFWLFTLFGVAVSAPTAYRRSKSSAFRPNRRPR